MIELECALLASAEEAEHAGDGSILVERRPLDLSEVVVALEEPPVRPAPTRVLDAHHARAQGRAELDVVIAQGLLLLERPRVGERRTLVVAERELPRDPRVGDDRWSAALRRETDDRLCVLDDLDRQRR